MIHVFEYLKSAIMSYGLSVASALLTCIVGLWAIEFFSNFFSKILKKSKFAISLQPFIIGLLNITLKAILIINVLRQLGFQTTSFVAILASAGLAIGMALSGTLQNFAGGVIILSFRPFKAGDLIKAQGHLGRVKEIQIFNTIITTPDNKVVVIPNGSLSNHVVVNYYEQTTRRVDMELSIEYNNDFAQVKKLIDGIIDSNESILKDKDKLVAICGLDEKAMKVRVRVWAKSSDYWNVFYAMHENIKRVFDKENITFYTYHVPSVSKK